jgi:NhaP-type Na+/H+ or K+/H+ antiporter
VLAAVAAGLYVGRKSARIISPASRVQAEAVWGVLIFLLNGLAFILIGLQLRALVEILRAQQITVGELLVYGALISLVVIVVRLAWVFPGAYLPYWLVPRIRAREPYPRERVVLVLGWMGMRGVVSLAAALALPLTLASGQAFHERPLIVLLAYCVILATLVGQGLTLPALMRRLHVGTDGDVEREEGNARLTLARAPRCVASMNWLRRSGRQRKRSPICGPSTSIRRIAMMAIATRRRPSATVYRMTLRDDSSARCSRQNARR